MGTYHKSKRFFVEKTDNMKNNHLKTIAKHFQNAENNGEDIANEAQDIKRYLKNLEKMVQKPDKTIGDERIEKFKQEKEFVDNKLNPALKKFEESCNKLNGKLAEIKTFFGIKSDQLMKASWDAVSGTFEQNKGV